MTFPTLRQATTSSQASLTAQANTYALGSAAQAGNLLALTLAGDKNTGTVTVTDNIGTAGGANPWTVEVSVPGASVSTYVAWKVAVGGETTVTATTSAASTTGNTGYLEEQVDDGTGAWMVTAKAAPAYSDTNVTSTASGTSDTADWDSRALAVGTIDSMSNLTSDTGPTFTGYTRINVPARPAGSGGGNAGCYVGTANIAKDATTSTTFSTGGGTDQLYCCVVAFGRVESSSVSKSGSDAAAGTESGYVGVPRSGTDSAAGTEAGYIGVPRAGNDSAVGTNPPGSVGATTTGADTAAGSSSAAIGANLTAAPDAAAGASTGAIRLPGGDQNTTSGEQLVDLHADVASGDPGHGAEGGYVETRYGELVISLFAVVDGALVALPDYTELSIAPTRNGAGSISVTYPVGGQGFELLRDYTVDADRDLEVEIWTYGSPTGARRGYLQEAAGDDVAESGQWVFTGGFAELRLGEAIVYPQPLVGEITLGETVQVARSSVTTAQWTRLTVTLGYVDSSSEADPTVSVPQKVIDAVRANAAAIPVLADPKRELKFDAATPGEMILFILAQARARGTLTEFATSFTATTDSSGGTWPSRVSTTFSPGSRYDQILDFLAQSGRTEWSVHWDGTRYVLDLWVAGRRGVDRSAGARPVVLRAGRNLAEAPRKWSVRESPTAMLGIGAEGWYADTADANAQSRRGRRIESSTSSQYLQTTDAVLAYAQRRLSSDSDGTLEVTHELAVLPGEPRPIIAFDIGDWLYSSVAAPLNRYRVVEWSVTVGAERPTSCTVTLNDAFTDAVVRARAQLDALSAGALVIGTSQPADGENVTPPSPPTGLLVSSGAFNEGIDAYAVVLVAWTAPTTNVDGSALTNLAGYRVEWTEYAQPTKWRPAGTVGAGIEQCQFTTATGLDILVRVAAYKTTGAQSAWLAANVPHTTETDSTPPPVPSAPVGASVIGRLIAFTWDGKSTAGADMFSAAPDFSHCELHLSTSSLFTPSASTLADTVLGRGNYTYARLPDGTPAGAELQYGVTYYCRLVSVDVRGNRQTTPSGQGSAVPAQLLGPDVFDGAVGSAKLADLAVITAKIANLAVNDAKIADLSVGKLTAGLLTASMVVSTGQISTRAGGTTGAGWTGDSAGLRLYDAAGNVNVQLKSSDGSAMIAGEYRTSLLTGKRLVFNPNGSSPDEIRFYPASTNQYGRMRTITSVAVGFENQAGMTTKAFSGRSDGQSGELSAFPSFASLAWGNEMDGGAITSRIAATSASCFIGGPKVDLSYGPGGAFCQIGRAIDNEYQPRTVLRCGPRDGGDNSNVAIGNTAGHSFIQFDTGSVSVVNDGTFIDINVDQVIYASERAYKDDVEPEPFDPAAVVAAADWYRYTKPGKQVPGGPECGPQLGLMLDELPDEVVRWNPDMDRGGVSGYGLTAILWGLGRQHIAELAELRREVAELRAQLGPARLAVA